MSEIYLKLEGPKITLETADATDVLSLLSAYLLAIRGMVSALNSEDKKKEVPLPSFSLPKFTPGSVNVSCEIQSQTTQVKTATVFLHKCLERPKEAPQGTVSAISELRECLLGLPDGMNVHANQNGDLVDLTKAVRGDNRDIFYSTEQVRARIIKTGGRPTDAMIRFDSYPEGTFSLKAHRDLAVQAGALLYKLVDVGAKLHRTTDGLVMPIIGGRVLSLTEVKDGPSMEDLREWYRKAHPEGLRPDEF